MERPGRSSAMIRTAATDVDVTGLRPAISIADVAAVLAVNHLTVRRLLDRGELEGFAVGVGRRRATWRIYVDSVRDYQDRQRHQPGGRAAPPTIPPPSARGKRPASWRYSNDHRH